MNLFSEYVQSIAPEPPGVTKRGGAVRAAQKEETQKRILEVARAHFERDGFEASSIRAIADDAEVAVGTVALHFVDKKGLLHAALYDDLERTIAVCVSRGTRGALAKRLTEIFEPAYEYYARRPQLSRTLLETSLFATPPWRERFGSQVTRVHMRIFAVVEAARRREEIASDVDANVFGAAIFSFYYMALIGWMQEQVPEPLKLFRSMVEQHVRGVLHGK
jgi:AcrR family transcriptional regulator